MQVHAQSTMTLAESRPPYIHLGYVSASCPGGGFRSPDFEMWGPGVILFLVGYLIAFKFNYGWLIGGLSALFRKFGPLRVLGVLLSILLLFGLIFVYCFVWVFQ